MTEPSSSANSAEAVVHDHLAAAKEGLDAVLAHYTEDSVLFTQDGVLKGLDEIRSFFEVFLRDAAEAMPAFTVVRLDSHGDYAYLVWKAEPFVPLATDTFVVKNGKILVQTFTAC